MTITATLSGLGRSRILRAVLALALILAAWFLIRRALLPAPQPPDEATRSHIQNVIIYRDPFGVPHIFGKTDPDTAFGLAYAHAEDDYPTIQAVLAASTGRLGLVEVSKRALANDFYANLIDVEGIVSREYAGLSPEYRALLEAYARGLNYYAYTHQQEVVRTLLPFRGQDLAAGFAHKVPLMGGLGEVLGRLNGSEAPRAVGEAIALNAGDTRGAGFHSALYGARFPGSNAHAVHASRSTDGITRLNVNSHQPWEGPVAWYEAHLVSEQGWDMIGGTFPGAPMILHGHNRHLGWAHTVNKPDAIDVYLLQTNEDGSAYRLDGSWVPFETRTAYLRLDLGLFTLAIPRTIYRSRHGPVMKNDHGFFAIRYAGMDRSLLSGEQWYRMNRARNIGEWKQAMRLQGIPMFHTVYADRRNVLYVYNALLARRPKGPDYRGVLPGDRGDLIWKDYLPFDRLPMVHNPPAGFVQNCNTSPFRTTLGTGNPRRADYAPELGIDTPMNNRGLRSLELFGRPGRIDRATFLEYKWDRTYARGGPMFKLVVDPLLRDFQPKNDSEKQALELLREWDGVARPEARGAAPAIFALQAVSKEIVRKDLAHLETPGQAFRFFVALLEKEFGRADVPLEEVQRLRRGSVDIGLGGGTDLLNAIHGAVRDGRLVGTAGDSYIMLTEFGPGPARSFTRHQYGNSSRPESPHYSDQARAFADRTLKPSLLTREAIEAQGTFRRYRPGAE